MEVALRIFTTTRQVVTLRWENSFPINHKIEWKQNQKLIQVKIIRYAVRNPSIEKSHSRKVNCLIHYQSKSWKNTYIKRWRNQSIERNFITEKRILWKLHEIKELITLKNERQIRKNDKFWYWKFEE